MKKTIRVVIEKEYEINIADELINQPFLEAFEYSFWELDGESFDEKVNSLFEAAAYQLARGEENFIEGIGPCASVRTVKYKEQEGKNILVVWNDTYDETEAEVVE